MDIISANKNVGSKEDPGRLWRITVTSILEEGLHKISLRKKEMERNIQALRDTIEEYTC